jgi:hypothetical protein
MSDSNNSVNEQYVSPKNVEVNNFVFLLPHPSSFQFDDIDLQKSESDFHNCFSD